jgi:hypothetical protein
MIDPKPWEDFEGYRLQLKVRRLETEKRLRQHWHSLRHSWENGGELLEKIRSGSSGDSKNMFWGPLGRFVMDLVRERFFRPKNQ